MAASRSETSGAGAARGMLKEVKRASDARLIEPTSALFSNIPSPGMHTGSRPACEANQRQVGAAMKDRLSSLISSLVCDMVIATVSTKTTPRPGIWQTVALERNLPASRGSISRLMMVRHTTSRHADNRSRSAKASVEKLNTGGSSTLEVIGFLHARLGRVAFWQHLADI